MKKIIGITMILMFFVGLFGIMADLIGFKETLIGLGMVLGITAWIFIGCILINP